MMLLLLALAVVGVCVAGRARDEEPGRRATVAVLLLTYGVPALFVTVTFFMARDEKWLRFALLGVGFRGSSASELVVDAGGDRDVHGLWWAAFSPPDDGTLQLEATPEDEVAARSLRLGRLRLAPSADLAAEAGDTRTGLGGLRLQLEPEARAGLWGHAGAHRSLQPVRAVALEHNDVLTVGEQRWTVQLENGFLGPAAIFEDESGGSVALPRRRGDLPIINVAFPIWRPFTAGSATYSLAGLAGALDPDGGTNGNAAPPGFLFHSRRGWLGLGSRLWLNAPSASVTLERAGDVVAMPSEWPFESGTRLHALSPPRRALDGSIRDGGVRDRRSFRVLAGRRSLAALYDTPEINVLPWGVLEELSFTEDDEAPLADPEDQGETASPFRLHLSMGGWQIIDRSLYFRFTSTKVALEAMATFELARDPTRTDSVVWTTPRGRREGELGQALWLGGEHRAAIQLDVLSTPWLLGLLGLLMAVAKVVAARAAWITPRLLLIAAPLEALVSLRLLLGYRVWAMPPYREEGYLLALVAWMMLPWCFLLVSMPVRDSDGMRRRSLAAWAPLASGWLLSMAWCWHFGGGGSRGGVWVLVHVLVALVVVARHTGVLARIGRALDGWLERPRSPRAQVAAWLTLAFVPGVMRALLLLVGFRESLQIGQRFALTLVHVPLGLLVEGLYLVWLWRRQRARGILEVRDFLPALAIIIGTWFLPSLLVSDLGLALLNVPVFLVAIVVLVVGVTARDRADGHVTSQRLTVALPVVALAAYLLVAAFPIGARALLALIPEQATIRLESERNYLRLLDRAYPKRLEEVARRGSEELAVMSAVMRSYTSGPVAGRGYLASEISPHIRATALREHVPAVFVASEWGLLGASGLLLLYLAFAAAGPRLTTVDETVFDPGASTGLWTMTGWLAALTLAIPSLYMVLANYRLTLFTGKNAYLLGLDSTADVLETLALVLVAALGAALHYSSEEDMA